MKLIYLFLLVLLNKVSSQTRELSNQSCVNDSDCKENSFCFENDHGKKGRCKCNADYFIVRDKSNYTCVQAAGIGERCVVDQQCELALGLESQCNEKFICECLPTAHYIPQKKSCYKTSRINETCVDNLNCLLENGNTFFCNNGYCTCGLNEHYINGHCVKIGHLGGTCVSDDSCIHLNAVCSGVCNCRVGYVMSNDEITCIPAVTKLGDPCEQVSQCTAIFPESTCDGGFCKCDYGFHKNGNRCFRDRFLGQLCDNTRECVVMPEQEGLIDCVNKVCTCAPNTDPKTCAPVGSACKQKLQSLGLAFIVLLFLVI